VPYKLIRQHTVAETFQTLKFDFLKNLLNVTYTGLALNASSRTIMGDHVTKSTDDAMSGL
jgi:hypothetical protein